MRARFQVKKDNNVIYEMDFPVDEKWQFDIFSQTALSDFHSQYPQEALYDVQMSWIKIS